jgi:mono/diheme cytochrome c family protein
MLTTTVACPSCAARLRVPGTVPTGKRIKCPKCDTPFPFRSDSLAPTLKAPPPRKAAPAEDEDDQERARRKPRQKGKPAPPIEDEAGPDLADERPAPRRPRKKRQKSASKTPLLVLLAGAAVLLLGGGIALAIAFGRSGKNPGHGGGEPQASSPGQKVFAANGCARCHSLGAGAGPGHKVDLSRVGADPSHTVEWISEHIRDPKSHRPDSRMPAYANRIPAQDLRVLAEYLASLK